MATKEEILKYTSIIDEKKAELDAVSLSLWTNPETAFVEFKSVETIIELLRKEGFEITENLTGIPTAFSGRYGHGKPVVGILCEYDALAGLAQVGCKTEKEPIPGQVAGQGCGHNLLGTGAIAAAIGIKNYLETSGHEGTVILFGTPGEEGGSGKAFMARDGAFDELDFALTWHPSSVTGVRNNTSLANYQVKYIFDGTPAHAGASPHLGRSALDALEVMNLGVQFLREHMMDDCRIHYAITDTGGFSPNVVQSHAEAIYLIRALTNQAVKDLYERVNDCARGAAIMTGTKEHHEFIKACSNVVPNEALQRTMQSVFDMMEHPKATEEENAFAAEISKTFSTGSKYDPTRPIHDYTEPYPEFSVGHGSTDVGDTSWVCPTAQCYGAAWGSGTPGHSWQAVSFGATDWAQRVTAYVGKVLAGTAIQVIENPEILQKAKEEHALRVGPAGYECGIPKDVKPRAISSL